MKMNLLISGGLLLLCLSNCQRKIPLSSVYPKTPMENKFPFAVEPNVREETLDANYEEYMVKKGTGTLMWSSDPFLSFFYGIANAFAHDRYIKDDRKKDARTIIERDIINNMGEATGTRKLIATVAVREYWANKRKWNKVTTPVRLAFGTLSAISTYNDQMPEIDPITGIQGQKKWGFPIGLGIFNAFGGATMYGIRRFRKQCAVIDIEVSLSDVSGNTIARYESRGMGQTSTGWYPWNYSKFGAVHYSNIKAVTMAMNGIKSQISKDYDKIIEKVKQN